MTIELHHLRHFVAVADEMHFGRAAERLGMTQPPLSQSIKRLEAGLGVTLFERSRRRVALTDAGRVFQAEATRTLAQADAAIRLTRRAASEEVAQLRIGFVSAALYRLLPDLLRRFRDRFPDVEIRLEEQSTEAQLAGLRDGSLDIGFVHPPLRNMDDLTVATVSRDRLIAAVPATHELADAATIELAALADSDFVLFPARQGPVLQGRIVQACRRAGFLPRIVQEAQRMHTILSLVAAGLGVSLVPEGARSLRLDGVGFVPVTGLPDDLAWELATVRAPRATRRHERAFVGMIQGLGD